MLVLMRRTHEEIVIPSEGITVKIIRTQGNRVSIGIEAPPGVPIRRSEIAPHPVESAVPVTAGTAWE